ncbi:2-polyprenyl-6-methoxyphenol hydroxylase and related FAD-dependent oxidoreductases [Methylobacterium aquaticum]|uniref:2-polyprenyl-6-methoxyphenol hydroxylase and related FAD-dependent oxidoreductases n=1 Tax=Methylobacterium aquaticum TaxID=270351 RepID=A0A0C6FPV5_9HYPH|nr:2-polyprenyl-6-methoxyphenol hydroxylase and related FAD-dependent oxidoreductases [Methylobacterium aquaticum]
MPTSTPMSGASLAEPRSVLVSGASFAGLATAFWLNRLGYRVTVVEVAPSLRRGGTPVDIQGETIAILTSMDLMEAVRERTLPPRSFAFKDAKNTTLGEMAHHPDDEAGPRYEIHRDDLLEVLSGAIGGDVELLFNCSIVAIEERPEGVSATFSDGSRHEFALIFGCDGNRSNTRRLVFGDGEQFTHFMGGYFYLKVVPDTGLLPPNSSEVFAVPGRMAMLNGYDDRTDIGFGFRTAGEIEYDHRNKDQQRRLIEEHFSGLEWKVPDMLAHIGDDNNFYFDRISQIRMPTWSQGRITLVGDAGYCVSPFAGLGGSMAIIGAGRLADALARHPDNYAAAFRAYEEGLRPFVEQVQERAAIDSVQMLFPGDEAEMAERDRKLAFGDIGV